MMGKSIGLYEGQLTHFVALSVLIASVVITLSMPGALKGHAFGLSTGFWLWVCVAVAVLHQLYVWLCWRLELIGRRLSKVFGNNALYVFAAGFLILGSTRFLLPWLLAYANSGTLRINLCISRFIAALLLIPALYLLYSVIRYFGIKRAVGEDHFKTGYSQLPFVREGIFRYTDNGMYIYGFLFFWISAFWFGSLAGLIVAAFNHLYIWVHYYCTERPDIRHIYGGGFNDSL
jgi:hypothetical protein